MPVATATRRLLGSPFVDLLVGPHGIDRYLELIRPDLTVRDARAEVIAVRRQTPRSVTLTLRPNAAWRGFRAGQFVPVGVEIDGVRRTRTYSPACSERAGDSLLELTVTAHPRGLVSPHLAARVAPGAFVHLGDAAGSFVLPHPRPSRLLLISGGSGVTPVMSMLRTLCDEGYDGEVAFVHYARTAADWLYRSEVEALARAHRELKVKYVATREGGARARVSASALTSLLGDLREAHAAVCGPPSLLDAVRGIWAQARADPSRVLSETFTPPVVSAGAVAAGGTVHFLRSDASVLCGPGTLLEQAEAAGLSPAFGCRMGICHTCTCRKAAGAVRDLRTGEISDEPNEDIQLCVTVPAGDIALEI